VCSRVRIEKGGVVLGMRAQCKMGSKSKDPIFKEQPLSRSLNYWPKKLVKNFFHNWRIFET
jgi:hypothetical protein